PTEAEILGSDIATTTTEQLRIEWNAMMSVREEANKALEAARQAKQIGANLEAKVKISAAEPLYSILAKHEMQLRYLLIISGIALERAAGSNGSAPIRFEVGRSDGQTCERCWNYSAHVGENKKFPTIRERCTAALSEMEGYER